MKIIEGLIHDYYTDNVVHYDFDNIYRQCPAFYKDGWCIAFGTFCQGFGDIDNCPLLKRGWKEKEDNRQNYY